MALLFLDGFDYYNSADFGKKWDNVGSTSIIDATNGRRGTQGFFSQAASTSWLEKNITSATYIIGFSIKQIAAGLSGNYFLCRIYDGATLQCSLRMTNTGVIDVVRGTLTALTNGSYSSISNPSAEHYIEWKVTIGNSIAADSCVVKVDGVEVINVAAGQDTQASGNAQGTILRFGSSAANSTTRVFDDLYICDDSGSTNNNFLGDVRVDVIYPDGDGTYTEGDPSAGSSNWAMVDETLLSETDYVSLDNGSPGEKDSYAFGSLPALGGNLVLGVQVNAAAATSDSGSNRDARVFTISSAATSAGASKTVGVTSTSIRSVFETDPNTSAQWSQSGVNAAEFGVEVTG